MPDQSKYHTEDEWMAACVPVVLDEGKDHDQAVAQCLNMWRERPKAESRIYQEMQGDVSVIYLYGRVTDDPHQSEVNPANLRRELAAAKTERIRLNLSSYGGDALAGLTMYNDLMDASRKGRYIETVNRGYVVSAMTLLFVAGQERIMARGSKLMIHEPRTLVTMSTASNVIENLSASTKEYAQIYADRSRLSVDEALEAMRAETWYTPITAAKVGLSTNATPELKVAAEWLPTYSELAALGYERIPDDIPVRRLPANRLHVQSLILRMKSCQSPS